MTEDQVLAFSAGALSRQQQREVDQHLDRCSECCDVVIGVATPWSTPEVSEAVLWSCKLQPHDIIDGRYRIGHFIARGGMGEVYSAHELGSGRPLALKTLLQRDDDCAQRLAREADLGLRVAHPNVCRTYGLGVHRVCRRAPLQFMTMELVSGPRLGQLLRRRALELPEILHLARQLLTGLAAIHHAGVLHLDFKSDNIVLRSEHESPEAVIIDFGLSRRASDTSTPAGMPPLAGTLEYMAPEHALTLEPSPSSDVFSFGVVLFEMLTRRLPFAVDRRSPTAELVRRMYEPPPKPSDYTRDISPALDAFVVRCLAGARRGRFRDGGEALGGLDQLAAVEATRSSERATGAHAALRR